MRTPFEPLMFLHSLRLEVVPRSQESLVSLQSSSLIPVFFLPPHEFLPFIFLPSKPATSWSNCSWRLYDQKTLQILPVSFSLTKRNPDQKYCSRPDCQKAGISGSDTEGSTWSVDHLLQDQHGRPTFLEVKGSPDSRIKWGQACC